ncbi:MAG: bestrophin family ion channel [Myxococcota bacterium]
MIQYDAHNWREHLWDVKGSMVADIAARVMACVAWSAAVTWVHLKVTPVAFPATLHSLVGLALGLLLVFRTNASYDRFWEGRKLWGGIVNETRNLARASRALISDDALVREIVGWTVAFPYACMHSLRGVKSLGAAADALPPDEVAEVVKAAHVPTAVALRISQTLQRARLQGLISDYVQMTVDANVQQLIDYIGGCERIHKTPLPFAYVVHLRRALILYTFTLPFALVDSFGWGTVLGTLVLAYTFFGIEEIGVEIEDPFGEDDNDLPLEDICRTIETNLKG